MELEKILPYLQCIICNKYPSIPYETNCCGLLFCKSCTESKQIYCPDCRKPTLLRKALAISKILSKIPTNCPHCFTTLILNQLESHYNSCPQCPFYCESCKAFIKKSEIFPHIIESHSDLIIENLYKPHQFDILSDKKNLLGYSASLGLNGKFYCGMPLDSEISCCVKVCGPIGGCNCLPCMKLDLDMRRIKPPFFVNKDGAITKATNVGVYCGRKVLEGVFGCDGYCGPTNGPSCPGCKHLEKNLQKIMNFLIRYR